MSLEPLLSQVKTSPNTVSFSNVIDVITQHYQYTPSDFSNGDLTSEAGTNEGSCKIFYFAQLNNLSESETVALFGAYYREDVLGNAKGNDHGNIRNFLKTGWKGISFSGEVLKAKS